MKSKHFDSLKDCRRQSKAKSLVLIAVCLLGFTACTRGKTPVVAEPAPVSIASTETEKATPVNSEAATNPDERSAEEITTQGDSPELDRDKHHSSTEDEPNQAPVPDQALTGNWTTRRLIALAPGGPTIVDLSVSLNGHSLDEASKAATKLLAEEIFEGLETPVTWSILLEQPLVKSGWLGNLIADGEQVSQLISMYDTHRDDIVTLDELGAFLTRGLARSSPIQISDVGRAPDADVSQSPWGVADRNQDYALDPQEIDGLADAASQFDYNGDAIVAAQELNQANTRSASGSMSAMSLLETSTLAFTEIDYSAEEDQSRESRRVASVVLGHYTFLEGVPRDQWPRWSEKCWQALDKNEDGSLTRTELEQLLTIEPDTKLFIRFPDLDSYQEQFLVRAKSVRGDGVKSPLTWEATQQGGRVEARGCIVELQVVDVFSGQGPKLLRQRLHAALKEPQLQAFFTSQLQLKEGAFELLDPNQDKQLSDEEFAAVWRWLSARQGTRLLARWMTAASPWFQLLDRDGDHRLTPVELRQAAGDLRALDKNDDSLLTPDELPLLVKLEVKRDDTRLGSAPFDLSGPMGAASSDADEDWFGAMDTNRDGFISNLEFLGGLEDFNSLDIDKDGFVGRSEVY